MIPIHWNVPPSTPQSWASHLEVYFFGLKLYLLSPNLFHSHFLVKQANIFAI